jgi:hypothetical protein
VERLGGGIETRTALEALHDARGFAVLPDAVDAGQAGVHDPGEGAAISRRDERAAASDGSRWSTTARSSRRSCARKTPRSSEPSGRVTRYSSTIRVALATALMHRPSTTLNAAWCATRRSPRNGSRASRSALAAPIDSGITFF